jgi:hypothetical protein
MDTAEPGPAPYIPFPQRSSSPVPPSLLPATPVAAPLPRTPGYGLSASIPLADTMPELATGAKIPATPKSGTLDNAHTKHSVPALG